MQNEITAQVIRKKYLDFMKEKGHAIIAPAPLVLEGDPTTLFTGSGMQPLIPYLLGEKHPEGKRLADSQPSLRMQDIDDVGDNRHTTSFEMLGNWSLGDYFKEFQIRNIFEFLTKEAGINPKNLYVTCFIGDEKNGIPRDNESAEIWQKLFKEIGISAEIAEIGSAENGDKRGMKPGERIFFYDDKENWWSRGKGIEGTPLGDPCGPDSEMFYDFGEENHDPSFGKAHPASDSGRFIEIGNQVFMMYRRTENGFEELKNKNVDFGGGLERIAAAAIDTADIFKISLIKPIIDELEKISGKKYEDKMTEMRIISDHLRAAVSLTAQGLAPSNKEQGYILRRLIRRAILRAGDLGIEENFIEQIIPTVIEIYSDFYTYFEENKDFIIKTLAKEEKSFRATLRRGIKELEKFGNDGLITGAELFMLRDTYGFPLESSLEEIEKRKLELEPTWEKDYEKALEEQRERSRTATKGAFKGGLDGDGEMTIKYHTVAHLLGAAMKIIIDGSVDQRGSNINNERLRFDFNIDHKLTPEEIKKLEDKVNEWISQDLPVTHKEYDTDFAIEELKAHGIFRDRYGDKVLVYTIGDEKNPVSREICGGPHVKRTGELGKFKITKEESSAAGIRRIKATLS